MFYTYVAPRGLLFAAIIVKPEYNLGRSVAGEVSEPRQGPVMRKQDRISGRQSESPVIETNTKN